ncbi:ABC transporter substrate-binding protein [Candidatus Poribacteria bacterium]|nr:ABC transporter substrate-binding protein [Candidatus Poribacteria bacterium]
MQKSIAIFCMSLLVLTFIGCDNVKEVLTPKPEPTVKIGFIVAGQRVTYPNGAQLAVDEINQQGGLFGMQVELIGHINSEAILDVSVQLTESLIVDEGIVALIGPNRSSHAAVVGPVAQKHRIPMVTTTATNPNVTNAGDFVFMASFTDSFQGAVMAQFAKMELGISTAAILTRSGDLYTEGISEFFSSNFLGLGGNVVAHKFFESGTDIFTEQLTQIADMKPDVLFTAGFAQDIVNITQQARAIPLLNADGEPTVFLGADSWDSELVFGDENAEVEGSYFSGHFSPETNEPMARAFVETYMSVYDSTPTGGVAVSYDAVKLLFEAIERAGSLEADDIRDQLAATENYVGATSIARYNENRQPTKSAVIFTIKDGQKQFYQQIDP